MAHALEILETVAIDLLDAVAILLFLLAGLVCAVLLERKVARALAPGPARSGADLPELLERLARSLRSYMRNLLAQDAGRFLPWLALIGGAASGTVGFAALSFGPAVHLADLNTGILFIFSASFLGICGDVLARGFSMRGPSLAGLARNAMRVASLEAAAALALLSGVILAGSTSVNEIVQAQLDQGVWLVFLAPLGFLLYLASSITEIDLAARTSIHPKSEGDEMPRNHAEEFHWPFGSLGASIHLLTGAGLATTVFLGGWLRPFASYHDHFAGTQVELLDSLPLLAMAAAAAYSHRLASREPDPGRKELLKIARAIFAGLFVVLAALLFAPAAASAVHGTFWFLAKMTAYIYVFLWLRARIPLLRFGRPIRAAWNFLIPLAAINCLAVAAGLVAQQRWEWSPATSTFATTFIALLVALWLGLHDAGESATYTLEP